MTPRTTDLNITIGFCSHCMTSSNLGAPIFALHLFSYEFSRANCNVIYTRDVNSGDFWPKKCT